MASWTAAAILCWTSRTGAPKPVLSSFDAMGLTHLGLEAVVWPLSPILLPKAQIQCALFMYRRSSAAEKKSLHARPCRLFRAGTLEGSGCLLQFPWRESGKPFLEGSGILGLPDAENVRIGVLFQRIRQCGSVSCCGDRVPLGPALDDFHDEPGSLRGVGK